MAATFDDVDPRIRAALAEQGITRLYPPQEEALDAALAGRHLVLSIPTASGKSLVAYLAILHRFLASPRPGKALYIVPLRALASEKYDELGAFRSLGLKVGIATGDLDQDDQRLGRFDVVVATSEKADSLLRHRSAWMNDVRLVVADEVHLITDPGRGPTLEVLLSRFRALNPEAQILALSATIKNAADLAAWLGADLVQSDWRPVQLKRGILFGRLIDFQDDGPRPLVADTSDPVANLVLDIVAEGGQALVFLSTRRSAEAVAARLARPLARTLGAEDKKRLAALAKELVDEGEPSLSGKRLAESVRGGAAFHTAGLSSRQRRALERNFREGLLKVLCATPTLAAGVNTPARRVIIRDLYRYDANLGNQPIPVLEIQQMMGRAGRPRYDPYGEAILIAKSHEERETLLESYLRADPEPITSKLGSERALRVHMLASVASGFVHDVAGLERFLDSTFYAHQGEAWLIKEQLGQVLGFLEEHEFLRRDGDRLAATPFGKRTSDLYVDPLSALVLRRAIERSRERPDAPTFAFLHAIASTPEIDPLFLRTKDDWVLEKLAEVQDALLFEAHEAPSHEEFLSHVKTASLLEDWIEEVPLETLEDRYKVGPGDIRNKVDLARWLAYAARELARLFHYETATALNHLPTRLAHGAKAELLPLIELDGVGRVRARTLHQAGYTSLTQLRGARVDALAALRGIGPVLAQSIKRQVGAPEAPQEVGLGAFEAPRRRSG